jgi:hypothetical protein
MLIEGICSGSFALVFAVGNFSSISSAKTFRVASVL